MKKLIALLLICCLTLAFATAYAAGPKITKQPAFGKSKSETTVVIEIKAKSFKGLTWRFVDPDSGDEVTAKELPKLFDGLKVKNPNKQKITLENVPPEMDGWQVYCHLTGNGYQVDSDRLTFGSEGGAEPAAPAPSEAPAEVVPAGQEPASAPDVPDEGDASAPESDPDLPEETESEPVLTGDEDEVNPEPETITVTGENVTLYPLDSLGNPDEDAGAASLSFTDFGSVEARADGDVEYWIVNGIRVIPNENVTSVRLQNITSDIIISAVLPAPEEAVLDDGDRVQVTCVGCRFTYMADNLVSVTSGSVPRGADIIVMAEAKAAAGGYSVNGGEYVREGKVSFRLTVTENTEIKTK